MYWKDSVKPQDLEQLAFFSKFFLSLYGPHRVIEEKIRKSPMNGCNEGQTL